ncbi:internalin [Amedibacillus sp. YH-ame10]
MSIWRKLGSMLFEETDADIIVEDELEDISLSEYKVEQAKKEEIKEEKIIIKEEPKIVQPVVEPVQEEGKKFVSIEITDEKPKQSVTTTHSVQTKRMNTTPVREEKVEFEFSPVISPIFGSKDDEKKPKGKGSSLSITLPKAKKANPLGTVISPYYGISELEEFEAEAQETIEKKEKSKTEDILSPQEDIETYVDDEDVNSLSLDDLIMDNDIDEEEDDIMQISLFGESTPIRDSDDEAEIK